MIYKFLFPSSLRSTGASLLLLAFRLVFGFLLMNHGVAKWSSFQEMSAVFPDPLGIGSTMSLGLAIFAELGCSMAFIVGFLYRLSMIPMIITMGVAFFVIHSNDPFQVAELAFTYLISFIVLYIAGPGKYSVDYVLDKELSRKNVKKEDEKTATVNIPSI